MGSGRRVIERFGTSFMFLFLLVYSTLLRISPLHSDTPVHTDAPGFLQVLALLRGEWHGTVAPFRIEYPVYPYLIFLVNHSVPTWLMAAKVAAFLPSLLVPVAVFAATLVISRDRYAAFFAGFLVASSPALIRIGAAPLYDSTFILLFSVVLMCGFLFIRTPTGSHAALVGFAIGACWASRGLGLFLVLPLLAAIMVLPDASLRRKIALSLTALALILATASLIRLPAQIAARSLPDDQTNCLKEVMVDGMRYAGGNRDQEVYRLNASATAFQGEGAGICQLGWTQFASQYYKAQTRAFAENLKRIVLYDLVGVLTPFIVFFIPLTLGLVRLLVRQRLPEAVFVGVTFASFLLLVSAIQYQDRYVLPLIIPVAVVAGMGCSVLMEEGKLGRGVLIVLVIVAFAAGIDGFRRTSVPDESEGNYRRACEWVVSQNGEGFTFGVMERHHGVYAYLQHGLVSLPVDDPARVKTYAEHLNVKYILGGPDELRHNPQLFGGVAFLKRAAEFGTGSDSVQVWEMIAETGDALSGQTARSIH